MKTARPGLCGGAGLITFLQREMSTCLVHYRATTSALNMRQARQSLSLGIYNPDTRFKIMPLMKVDKITYANSMLNMATYEIYRLKVSNGFFINFTYIIVDKLTKLAAIVDPSWDIKLINKVIHALNIKLESIMITHSHYDHINLVSALVARYKAKVYMHKSEIIDYQFECDNLTEFLDLTVLELGSTSIICIWTPGHTSGSSSFLLSNDLLTGDTLFSEGVGVCFLEIGGNPNDLFKSVQRLATIIRNDILIHPGHSFWIEPGLSFKELYKTNIYLHFNRQEDFVAFRMRKNQSSLLKWLD